MIYLYLKTHNVTGLKYLGKTEHDPYQYSGSGVRWKAHLKKHGHDISTEVLFKTEDKAEFKKVALEYSNKWNIVESADWANRKPEEGDGGDTTSNRMWITNGNENNYIYKEDSIPDGWRRGRSNCVFNDPAKQKEFNTSVDQKAKGEKIKAAWADPDKGLSKRDHSKCGTKGDKNPSKRPEVREKIRKAALLRDRVKHTCIHCGAKASIGMITRWHNERCKYKP